MARTQQQAGRPYRGTGRTIRLHRRGFLLTLRQSKHVEAGFKAERTFLVVASKAKKPDMDATMKLLRDLQIAMERVDEVRQKSRDFALKDSLSMVGDGMGTLGWVTYDNKPHEVIHDLFGGAQMYGNKVLKEYRDK